MRVAIVDDEPLAGEILQNYLARLDNLELAGVCRNALEAFSLLSREQVDLLFLDINMPELNGIEFLKTLKTPPLVIFTTAYSEYAVTSYELNAVDYLLKPVSFDRFMKAVNKAFSFLHAKEAPVSAPQAYDRSMFVRSDGRWVKIDLDKLWFAEGLKDYIRLWMNDGRITIHGTMKNFEEQLKPFSNFIRVHKSYLVNLDFVEEVDSGSIKVKTETLAIGHTYKEALTEVLNRRKLL